MYRLVLCTTILLSFSINVNHALSEYYSSVYKMSQIMDMESKMLENMQNFIRKNENKLDFLKERLAEYERERDDALTAGPIYFENPVNKYLLTKRLTTDWERIENILEYNEGEKHLKNIEKRLLNDTELYGAIEGLLRIQDVYRLNTSDIARGVLQDVQYETYFESHHCFDIGKQAVDTNMVKLGHSWLNEGLKRYTDNGNDFEKIKLQLALADAKFKLGDTSGANQTYADLIQEHPESEVIAKLYSEFVKEAEGKTTVEIDYSIEHDPLPADIYRAERAALYKYTCAGILKKSPTQQRKLSCGYLWETHPFLWLAPIKVEEINLNPLLVVFHEVVYDSEIEIIKNITGNIERATVLGERGSSIVSNVRTSQFQFLPPSHHPVLQLIDRRVEDMTNLNRKYYEHHQFANYGIGGHYGHHHDWFVEEVITNKSISEWEQGNRIATVLFYLSDVEQGGGTAFPFLESLLMPRKGSAAFWFNLHASGAPDDRSMHGACPIIVGSKWVQNRWIRVHDQSDRRPCYRFDDTIPIGF